MERKNWINKLDDLEEGASPEPGKYQPQMDFDSVLDNRVLIGMAAAMAVLLILVIILFFRTGKDVAPGVIQDVYSRVDALETRISSMENREEERQRAFMQFVHSEQDIKSSLESQKEAIDDLRQQIAEKGKPDQRPAPAAEPAPAPVAKKKPEPEKKPEVRPETAVQYHEVQRGENLFRIGLKYNISVDMIRELNNLSPEDSIYPGQKLIVGK